jgi:hypothetical protein
VERPRTDETAPPAESLEQPVIEPIVETTPAPAADAPDTTTPERQVEDATKLEPSAEPAAEKPKKPRAPRKKKES